jgi:hypothetical protein
MGMALAFAGALVLLALLPAIGSAATREPLSVARAALQDPSGATDSSVRPDAAALAATQRNRALHYDAGAQEVKKISSTYYGAEAMAPILATLRGLDHGPELAQLSVYVATPEEIVEICGATVVACYVPSRMEMVVSGVDAPVAGVPRDFAIAHEYGHHIANSQHGDLFSSIDVGTIRWATYERVCQFTRAHQLFPGNQGNHYWEDPEEAFAESYAHLTDPAARVSWQYTPLLQPTTTSLAKIQVDLAKPWTGPTTSALGGTLAAPSAGPAHRIAGSARSGIDSATVVGPPPWIAWRQIQTPLDGNVSVSLQAPAGADYAFALRDGEGGRVLATATTGEGGSAEISYGNCGHDSLQLEVRSLHGSGPFRATVVKP